MIAGPIVREKQCTFRRTESWTQLAQLMTIYHVNSPLHDENGKFDLESIYALDIELFNKNMLDLINGEEVQLPKFDFKIGKRVPET